MFYWLVYAFSIQDELGTLLCKYRVNVWTKYFVSRKFFFSQKSTILLKISGDTLGLL